MDTPGILPLAVEQGTAAPDERLAIIRRVIADLAHLNHQTENDFLRIGGKLAEFMQEVNFISSRLSSLTGLIAGQEGVRASHALTSALDRSTEMGARHATGNVCLSGIRDDAHQLRQVLTGYRDTVPIFSAIGLLTRIEIARLGTAGANFTHLIQDIQFLAANVQTKVENALQTAATLIPAIETAMQTISSLEDEQTKDLPAVVSAVSASLSSFRETQDRARDLSVRLAEQFQATSSAFGKLIVSIQFHDITRQQIEHVSEALQRLCSESLEAAGLDPNAVQGSAGPGATAVLVLQCSQLAHAAETFSASVASLSDNLDEIAARIMQTTEESRDLFRHSPDEKNSLFQEMERCYGAILARLTHCTRVEVTSRQTSDGMADTLVRMRGSIQQVQTIGMKMFYAAINARIGAARLGEKGNTLDVLADSMRQGALESIERSESLIALLDSMSMATFHFSGQTVTEGEDACLAEMRVAVAELHSSGDRSLAQISEIVASGAKLRDELSATRESLTVGSLFAESVSRATGALKELADRDRAGLSSGDGEEFQRQLAELERHYTMQSERDVHAGAIGAKPATGSPATSIEDSSDDIEFF